MSLSNTNLNVYFFQTGDFPEGNGANSRLKILSQGLSDNGYNVTLNYLWPSSFNQNKINTQKKGKWGNVNFRFLSLFITRPKSILGKLIDTVYSTINSSFYIIKHISKIDVFYLYNPTFFYTFHIIALAKLAGKHIVFEKTELFSTIEDAKHIKKWNWRYIAKNILKLSYKVDEHYPQYLCNQMIVISENLYKVYSKTMPPDKLTLIPILVDTNKFTATDSNATNTIGYLGSFGYKDGVPGLIEAFSIALKTNHQLKLKLIGFADNISSLNKLIKHFNVESAVQIIGQANSNNIVTELHSCDLLICNRINNSYANYGSPTKVAEYLATGIPTIVTNVGDINNYLTNSDAIIIEPENTKELTDVILNRYTNYEDYSKLGLCGMLKAKEYFTFEKNADKLIAVIHNKSSHETISQNTINQTLA